VAGFVDAAGDDEEELLQAARKALNAPAAATDAPPRSMVLLEIELVATAPCMDLIDRVISCSLLCE
jgi:hypothetical protein